MFEPTLLAYVSVVFLVAGITKGIVGGGLPVMSIGLLTVVLSLPEAIALVMLPATITNFWQASTGGYFKMLVWRLWPYILTSILAVILGTMLLIIANPLLLTILLGLLMAVHSLMGIAGIEFKVSHNWEKTSGPAFGFITGLFAGMTGSPAYPGLYYLSGLGFDRNQLVQAMGICFSVVTLSVAISMQSNNLLSFNQIILSLIAVVPAISGMVIGSRIRQNLSENNFKKLFYLTLLFMGIYLVARSLLRMM
ncbi:MAG: sulfite exporter TauE/SafE family protein [Rhizobiaceae bacterium]|nr:sulfite exporter TauE/SafE family protein [Rhizobiaceae bacterium]